MANVFVEITDPHAILRYRQAGLAYFDLGNGKRNPPAFSAIDLEEVHGWIQNGFRYYLLIDTDDEE